MSGDPTEPATALADAAAWRAKTTAELWTPEAFAELARARGYRLHGVMGYADAWQRSGLSGEELRSFVADARRCLERALLDEQAAHGSRLVMVSGATKIAVLELAYSLCEELGILAMGVTSRRALRYPLAPMRYLVPVGREFGDESEVFVSLCDAFTVLGGGEQSRREAELGLAQGKVVTLITGFGGAADALAAEYEVEPPPTLRVIAGR